MSVTTTVRKPVYAAVGASDLALEKARVLPGDAVAKATVIVPQTTAFVFELPGRVLSGLGDVGQRGSTLYRELTVRGQVLVGSIRRQPASQAVVAEVKNAERQVKGATTSARKATKAAGKAVEAASTKIG